MNLEQLRKNASFYFSCKENYFLNIHPLDLEAQDRSEYQNLVHICKLYFEKGFYDTLAEYLDDEKYLLNLWAAYLILKYGDPQALLKEKCSKVLYEYNL